MTDVAHTRLESGLRDYRLDFAREDSLGVTPTDPEFIEYSPNVQSFSWTPEAEPQGRRSIGSPDVISWEQGSEIHDVNVVYDLTRWFEDDSGNPNDAAWDAMFRDEDNLMSSHTVVARESKTSLQPENTVNGETAKDTRIYTVALGAVPAELEVQGDPSDAFPVQIDLGYRAQSTRSYQIDQPESDTNLHIESTSDNDTMEITIEDEGATTSASFTLSGTTTVDTDTETYADIDAVWLSEEPEGNITIYEDDGGSAGDELMVIHGKEEYGDLTGDQGIPVLGDSGTRTPTTGDPETFIGAQIDRDGTQFRHEIPSATLTVSNDLEELERATAREMGVYAGNREISFDMTLYGEAATHDTFDEMLRTIESPIDWHLASGTLTVENATYTDPGAREVEPGQAVMEIDATFGGQGISITTN